MKTLCLIALLGLHLGAGAADLANGQRLFNVRCASCHAVGPSASNGFGPQLNSLFGRRAGSGPGYSYSPGLTKKGGTWTDAALDAYLTNPTGYAPGTKMFNRVGSPQARTAIITYLKTQK